MSQEHTGWWYDGDIWICEHCETGYDEPQEHACKPGLSAALSEILAEALEKANGKP